MITAVIFDRDGVLTNFDTKAGATFFESLLSISIEELATRWRQWGNAVGFPRSMPEEKLFWTGFWQKLGHDLNLPVTSRAQLHRIDYKLFLKPFADARTALLTAREHGLYTGVLSNFTLASLDESLAAVGLADLIDVFCAATVIGAAKPEPAAYLTAARSLMAQPAQCLFFDDEPDCIEGALALGMQAYLVDRQRANHDLGNGIVCDLTALPLILNQAVAHV
jgi:putative hydrolase of the HAD superfamily